MATPILTQSDDSKVPQDLESIMQRILAAGARPRRRPPEPDIVELILKALRSREKQAPAHSHPGAATPPQRNGTPCG